jgi:hypothetical protein
MRHRVSWMGKGIRAATVVLGLVMGASVLAKSPQLQARFQGTQTLVLEFPEPMQTWSNEVRGDVVRITPTLPATCSWDSDLRMTCRLAAAAAQATRYRIDLAAGQKTQAGATLPAQVRYVETQRPTLGGGITSWKDGTPTVELWTDMAVDPASVRSVLRIDLSGESIEPLLQPLPPQWKGDTRQRFRIAVPATTGARLLTVRVEPGLRTNVGPLPGQQDEILLRASIHDPFVLHGVACAGPEGRVLAPVSGGVIDAHCVPGQPVQLVFSQELQASSQAAVERRVLAAAGKASSAASGDTARDSHWFRMQSPFGQVGVLAAPAEWSNVGDFAPGSHVELRLDGTIRSMGDAPLAPVTVRIKLGEAQPHLRARQRALVADGMRPPTLVEAINVGTATLEVRGVGAQVHAGSATARSPRQGSVPQAVTSPAATQALAEGGWVRWTPTEKSVARDWRTSTSVEFAAPAFDLLALSGRREVLAWANEWDRDAPVSGAQIELLWLDPGAAQPRVIAHGRTGADGTVLLQLPGDIVVPEPDDDDDHYGTPAAAHPMWLLRASSQDADVARRAVLPMSEAGPYELLGRAGPRRVWGVSDRLLYHAGDTVHYRLWQRELYGARLRAPHDGKAVPLRLQNAENDKVVLEWQATPAADGSIAGDIVLPVHLTDATYCVGVKERYENTDGTCFFVGTYRAQDLWLEAKSRGGVLRDGDRFVAEAKAGYFSGGAAAGADVTRAAVSLEPEALQTAYPKYADFTFIDVDYDDVEYVELAGMDALDALDANGALRIDVPVAFDGELEAIEKRPAFGLLTTELEVSPEDREGTSAYEQATRYARYGRYVGLRTRPEWFGATDPVSLEAVVITARGEEVTAEVEVVVEYVAGYSLSGPAERIAGCVVRTRQPTPCAFARERTGYYRLTARSGDAAPAMLQRYVWWRGGLRADVEEPELTVLDGAPQRDRPARLMVKQPFDRARALFAITLGGTILGHRIEAIEGNAQEVLLPLAREWRGMLEVKTLVREGAAAKVEAGFRKPVRTESIETTLPAAVPAATTPVSVRFQATQAKPGTQARITLRNDSAQPRQVTLSVMDDALRAQAQRWLPYADPMGPTSFRESLLLRGGGGSVSRAGFDDWTGEEWRWLLPWAKDIEREVAAPARQLRASHQASPAAPLAGFYANDDGEATTLDRIEVTGSRIKRVDVAESTEAKAPDPSLRLDRPMAPGGTRPATDTLAVRTHFADTALWLPDIHLAPGESREVELALPDNLTRWRAVAWSADAADDFAMTEAALEVGLPVEARLQAPVRLYPGDTSRVATSVRHSADAPAIAQAMLQVQGEGGNAFERLRDEQSIALAMRGQGSVATTLRPRETGTLHLVASAHTPAGGDAVAGAIEVASPLITTRKLQAGWIGEEVLRLDLSPVPEQALAPSLHVSLLRGNAGLTSQWTQDLHDYPHRCWEQILSRAVGAALALERQDPSWPDAGDAVKEALDNAAVFQLDDGGFVYFPGMGDYEPDASVTLTAYTLRAFALLRSLGHPVSTGIEAQAREFLADVDPPEAAPSNDAVDEDALASFAFAAAAQAPEDRTDLDPLWAQWKQLSLPVQVASAQAFARAGHPAAARAVKRLLEHAPARGPARTLRLPQRYDAWMSSDLREQCALIDLLREHPQLANARVRRELLAGISDLYAGGVASVDTQSGAYCLMALRDPGGEAGAPAQARFAIGAREQVLELKTGQARADWDAGRPDGPQLRVDAGERNTVPVSYVAQLTYREDARTAQASAVGLSIERRHEVLRDGTWKAIDSETLREGDWIRITLAIATSATREFVAVTDSVPGGLQPTDLELSGVGSTELKRIAGEGSGYFETRKLDPRHPRFYAEALPPGRHELHYFARVGNSGDYLAAPAMAELMYGSATYARTAATRIRISEDPPEAK